MSKFGRLSRFREKKKGIRSDVRHPEYASEKCRLTTFSSWRNKEQGHLLAKAGFFSTNKEDAVRCFMCGLGLKNWDSDDEPWVEHARWMPQCKFVVKEKSPEFIKLVQDAVEKERKDRESADVMSSIVRDATCPDTEADCPSSPLTRESDPSYPDSTYEKNPLLTDAAQSVLEMGYLPKTIKCAVDNVLLQLGDWRGLTGQRILVEIFRLEDDGMLKQQCKPRDDHLNYMLSKEELDDLEAENERYRERNTCKICCERTVSVIFLPCSHLVCCAQCSPALKTCPMCRESIKGTARAILE